MTDFNPYEEKILRTMLRAQRPLSTSKIADRSGIAWKTAKKYLAKLLTQNYVKTKEQGNTRYWWVNGDL